MWGRGEGNGQDLRLGVWIGVREAEQSRHSGSGAETGVKWAGQEQNGSRAGAASTGTVRGCSGLSCCWDRRVFLGGDRHRLCWTGEQRDPSLVRCLCEGFCHGDSCAPEVLQRGEGAVLGTQMVKQL